MKDKEETKKSIKNLVTTGFALGTVYMTYKYALKPMGKVIKGIFNNK